MDNIEVIYGKIPNGTDDIANLLELNPSKTLFMHSTSFDEKDKENIKRRAINKGRMLFAEPLSYTSTNEFGPKTAIAYFNDELLNKFNEMGVLRYDNILKVSNIKNLDFPNNSVSWFLNKLVKEDEKIRNKLTGYTIVSSYLSKEDEETAEIIKGKLLMDRKLQEKFNSKYDFRLMAEKYKFSVPDGVCVKGLNELNEKLEILKGKDSEINNLWIKLESQSSGMGNIKIDNYHQITIDEIKSQISKVASKIFDNDYIENEMPFIVETDINIKGFHEVANIGVEAVISSNKVTILGGVEQETRGGKYYGSQITENSNQYMNNAIQTAIDAFKTVCLEGYRGFMTIDVLVTKNDRTGEIRSFNIDPNARFSAGTMLLKNIHTSEAFNNKKMYGISFSNSMPKTENTIQTMFELIGDDLYNNHHDYTGIIPALINDINEIGKNRYYLKTVIIDYTYKKAKEKFNNFNKKAVEILKRGEYK